MSTRKVFSKGSLHGYLLKHHKPRDNCVHCDSSEYPTQHALIHGREYSLDINDYLDLCPKCHKQYDYHLGEGPECNCNLPAGTLYPHGWNYAKIPVPPNTSLCEYCGGTMEDKRSTARYCKQRCATNAYRVRKGFEPIKNKYDVCQREGCENLISEDNVRAKYCSSACRKKVYNDKPEIKKKAQQRHIQGVEIRKKKKAFLLEKQALKKAEKEAERLADEWLKSLS